MKLLNWKWHYCNTVDLMILIQSLGGVDYTFRYTKAKREIAKVDEQIQTLEKRIEKRQQILHQLNSKQQSFNSIQEEEQRKWAVFIETAVRKHAEYGRKRFASLVRVF